MDDGLTLEERQRQAAHQSMTQQMDQTQYINQSLGQQMAQSQVQSRMEQSADMQTRQKEPSILSQLTAIPVNCCKMEQDLDKEAADAGKLGRRAVEEQQQDKRRKINEERETYHNFFETAETCQNKLMDKLDKEEVYNADTVSGDLSDSLEGVKVQGLFTGKHPADSKEMRLYGVFERLRAAKADAVTTEQLEQLKNAYLELGFADAGLVGKQYFDTEDTKGAYVILFYNVASQLFELLNGRKRKEVNLQEMAKLGGIASASALAVGTMCGSEEFRSHLNEIRAARAKREQDARDKEEQARKEKEEQERKRKEREEQARKEREEQERKRKEQEERERLERERIAREQETLARNLAYIRKGTDAYGKDPATWQMAEYAGMVERAFGEEQLKTMTLQDVARNVARMQKCIEWNQKLIAKAAVRAGDVYQLPVLHEALKAKLTELIGDNLLKEEYKVEKMQELVKAAKEQMPPEYAVYQEYFDYLAADELFSQIPDVCRNGQIQAYMTGCSLGQFKAAFAPLREQLRVNLETVRQQIAQTLAEPLQDLAQQAFLKRERTVLLNASPRELRMKLEWYLTYLREYEPELFDKKNGVDQEHYLKKPKQLAEKSAEKPSKERDLYAELTGELLFGWEGFGGAIASQYTGDPVKTLEQALEKQRFPQAYLKNVRCVADLNTLQGWQFAEFMASLRANLAETVADWSRIQGPVGQKLRDELFPGMLDGSVRKDNFQASMEKLLGQYDNEQELLRQRRNVLIGLTNKPHGGIQYRYLDVIVNTALDTKARNVTRTRRLQNAALARQIVSEKLRDGTYDYEIMERVIGREWKENKKENGQPQQEQKPLTNKAVLEVYKSVSKAKADTIKNNNSTRETMEKEREARRKKGNLTEAEIQDQRDFERRMADWAGWDEATTFWMDRLDEVIHEDNGCGLELLISGVEDLLLKNKEFRTLFASAKREVYEEKLAEWADVYQHRRSIISSKFYKHNEAETVREALVGLEVLEGEDVEARKKRNLERFGVEGFAELVKYMEKYREAQESEKEEVKESVQRYEKRLGQLCSLRGGLYDPLKDQLVEDKKVFEALTVIPDAAYESFLAALDQRLFPPMQELAQRYGIKSGFAKQVVLEYGSSILHETKDRSQWKKLFSDYSRQINDYMIGDHSISDTFRTIVQKEQVIAPYLIAILMDEEYGSMILADKKKWEEEVKKYRTNIEANEKELAEHVPNQKEYEDLQRNLLVPIATQLAQDFQKNLPGYLEDYRKQKAAVQKDVVRATEVMEDRRWTLLTVEVKKERGRKSDEKDREVLRSMKYANELLTPVIMTYRKDNSPVPDCKTIAKAHKAVKSALGDQIAKLPDIVTDLLTERVAADASGMNEAALRREAEHLQELYKKIAADDFGEKQKNSKAVAELSEKMDERMQESLLTYLYCKEKIEQKQDAGNGYEAQLQTKDDGSGFEAYVQTEQLLAAVKNLPVSGKFAAREKEELLNAAQMARYTMPEKDFQEFVTRRMHYVEHFDQLEPVCEQMAAEYEKNETQAQALKLGLLVYYREELNGGQPLNIASLSADMKQLLKDEHVRTYLAQTKAQLLESTGNDALTAEEQQTDTVMDREHFEQELEMLLDQDAKKQYNPLSVQQRMIFALALCVPGMDTAVSGLAGYRLVREEGDGDAELLAIHAQVQRYIHYDAFAPDIDYAKAFYRLQTGKNEKKKLNQTAFGQAMTFVRAVESSRQAQYEPDYARLSDAQGTIAAAQTLLDKSQKKIKKQPRQDRIKTPDQFFERLTELDELSKDQRKRLENIKNNQVSAFRLIQILQDRTVADYSTAVGAAQRAQGEVTLFVNEGKRQAMLEQAEKGTDITAQTSVHFDRALQTLLSYQLRNDIPVLGERLAAGDFAKGALQRDTAVDWELLDRAMTLVEEMNRVQMRMNAIRHAPKLINQSKNEKAKEAYRDCKPHTREEFEGFLENQAKKDGKLAVLAGYQMLNEAQRELFIKALGSRWVLDISKEHIMANRFGMMERDYADPVGRDALSDEYFENAMSAEPGVELSESAYEEAFAGILSTQVDDSLNYSNLKNEDLSKHLSKGEQLVGDSRQTAVDWKLVMRALQMAHRCSNESEIYAGDWELYVSQGDLSKTGQFGFESAYMRRNLHNAGNRLTRHLGRRVAENVMDQLPGPLMSLVRASISVNANNALAQYAAFEQEEEKPGFAETAADLMETAGGELENAVGEALTSGSDMIGYGMDVKNIIDAGQNVKELKAAVKEAERFEEKDEQKMAQAAVRQSSQQAAVSRSAKGRNEALLGDAVKKATQRQTDQIIDSVSAIFSRAVGNIVETGGDALGAAVTETGKIINLIRNYQNDKTSVKAYFESQGELDRLRQQMESGNSMEEAYHESDPLELLRQARGYENYTEMASFVGLNVTRSLLFCASAFNRQEALRATARETLKSLGMEDVIGKWDNDSAERVYAAIMGGEYR